MQRGNHTILWQPQSMHSGQEASTSAAPRRLSASQLQAQFARTLDRQDAQGARSARPGDSQRLKGSTSADDWQGIAERRSRPVNVSSQNCVSAHLSSVGIPLPDIVGTEHTAINSPWIESRIAGPVLGQLWTPLSTQCSSGRNGGQTGAAGKVTGEQEQQQQQQQ